MDQSMGPRASSAFAAAIYLVAFVTGAIVMSFEMLGSRYLNPYFGSGIYTWASLISTVLAALCVGYFVGGLAADRYPSPAVLGATVLVGTTFFLIPTIGTRAITFTLGIAGVLSGLLLIAVARRQRAMLVLAILTLG